jgi:phospholipase/carboxylesterase
MKDLSLKYNIKKPEIVAEKSPLILLLHGYGSNDDDLFSFATELPKDVFVVAAQAPYSLQYGSYAWYAINFDADENKFSDIQQAITSRDLVVKFIDELIEEYAIDNQKITLVGFSQGSILSYSIALSYPEKIEKVAAFSGYFNEKMVKDDFLKNDFSKLKIFVSHGAQDQVIPVAWAQKAPKTLTNYGIKCEYHEYQMGHGINQQNFIDFMNWLRS